MGVYDHHNYLNEFNQHASFNQCSSSSDDCPLGPLDLIAVKKKKQTTSLNNTSMTEISRGRDKEPALTTNTHTNSLK